jgi:hypothetical protein
VAHFYEHKWIISGQRLETQPSSHELCHLLSPGSRQHGYPASQNRASGLKHSFRLSRKRPYYLIVILKRQKSDKRRYNEPSIGWFSKVSRPVNPPISTDDKKAALIASLFRIAQIALVLGFLGECR